MGTDTFDLTTSSTWPIAFYASNGTTLLTDTDTDTVIDTGPIAQGSSKDIIAKFTTPGSAQVGDNNAATITATSSLNIAKSKTSNLSMAIPAGFVNIFEDDINGAMSFMTAKAAGTNTYKATTDNYYGYDIAVTKLANNNYLYTWSKTYYTGSYYVNDIEYAILAPNGAIIRPPTRLTDSSSAVMTTRNYAPSISVAPNGTVGFVWRHYFYNSSAQYNYNIYFATLDGSGNLLTGPFNVTNNMAWGTSGALNIPQYYNPTVAAADDNNFILGWRESLLVGASNWQRNIWYATRTSTGTSLFGPAKLTSDNGSWSPVLNPLTGGKAILTWTTLSTSTPYYAVINSNGSVFKPVTSLPGTPNDDFVDAVLLPNGKVGVAWTTFTGVQLAILNSSYNLESGPTSASNPSSSEGYSLSMTTDSSSRVIMTWIDWSSQNLHYALGDSSGTFLTSPMYYKSSSDYVQVSFNGQGVAPLPDITLSGNAGVAGATLSYTEGTLKTVTADGSGNYSITVTSGWTGTITPSLATDAFCPASQNYANVSSNRTLQHYAHAACPNFGNSITKWTNAFDLSHGWTVSNYVRTTADVSGDGKADLVGFGQNGVWVSLSTGSSFPAPTRWVQAFDLAHGWTVQDYVRTVGDVNGDGKADLVGFGQNGVWVSLSTGSSFPAPTRWVQAFDLAHGWTVQDYVRTVGDVNGDGKADLVGFGQNGVWVSLSTGSSFPAPTRWVQAFDLAHGWTVQDYVRTVGDVNGDGKADLVGFGQNGVWVSLSTGSSFPAPGKWTSAFDLSHGWTVAQYVRTVGDMNGDAMADLVGFGLDGVYVAFSNGGAFGPISRLTNAFDLSHGWTVADYVRTVGDVNGGGKADLVGFGQNGVYIAVAQ
jgi:hypothetical protein